MLQRDPHENGWQVELRVGGFVRFLPVAFLIFWLCGWAVGEGFALVFIASALHSFGVFPAIPGLHPISGVPPWPGAIPIVLFMLLWFALWTFGGIAAGWTCLRLLLGRDVVRWGPDGIECEQYAGLLMHRMRISRDEVVGVYSRGVNQDVMVETVQQRKMLTAYGSREDRRELAEALAAYAQGWIAAAKSRAVDTVPQGWRVIRDEAGHEALFAPWLGGGRVIRVQAGSVRYSWRFVWWNHEEELTPVTLRVKSEHDTDGDEVWKLVAGSPQRELTLARRVNDPAPVRHMARWLAARAQTSFEDAA